MTARSACETCACAYASVGAAFFCPACGHNSAVTTFAGALATIRASMKLADDLPPTHGRPRHGSRHGAPLRRDQPRAGLVILPAIRGSTLREHARKRDHAGGEECLSTARQFGPALVGRDRQDLPRTSWTQTSTAISCASSQHGTSWRTQTVSSMPTTSRSRATRAMPSATPWWSRRTRCAASATSPRSSRRA